jgi:hypothetical protein
VFINASSFRESLPPLSPFLRIAPAAVVLDGTKPVVEQGILGER